MSHSHKFWDRIAKFYANQPVADEAAYKKKLAITQDYFEPTMKVLEFGCGTGSTAIAHAPFVKHIQAIDVSSKMLDIARDKANHDNIKNIIFEKSSISDFTPSGRPLDAVMGHNILHLLENKEDVIAKIHKILKPGGIFVTSTTCLGNGMTLLNALLITGNFLRLSPLVRFFSKEDLEKSLTTAGFQIDYMWQPDKGKSVFIVAKKAA